ncbi:hypothetical protein RUM44_009016 [Polyplax serrata]|uniref:F-box domain-containing protein n=1 Tax=Polyplax serrata TaxID=468196 RepID=A0ABR1ASZ7_POLSC
MAAVALTAKCFELTSGSETRNGRNSSVNSSKDTNNISSSRNSADSSSSTDSITEGEEQDDSSSSQHGDQANVKVCQNVEDELSNFRQLWRRDISANQNHIVIETPTLTVDKENNEEVEVEVEHRARKWFLQGVEHEKNGRLIEAIRFYRRAVQLVPDIEFKLCDALGNKGCSREPEKYDGMGSDTDAEEADEHVDSPIDLMVKLQRIVTRSKSICRPAREQRATHISSLPVEIILYILRWVVSHDLDLRSLEMCSMVCRGFYLVSRDAEIWRLACIKVWGVNCGNLKMYDSWRTMYLKRPRLNYNGCYISKTTYVRHGETSFQDQFYRPWHVVEYYRYFRFFPEGIVYMLTTPDQPAPVTCILKGRENRHPSLLTGHYRLQDDKIFIVLQREDLINNRFKKRKNTPADLIEQTFHITVLCDKPTRYHRNKDELRSDEQQVSLSLVLSGQELHDRIRKAAAIVHHLKVSIDLIQRKHE